jgi:catechol 2,3-dioxygenase-like lactoylglutathione lyase family enzyme
MRPTVITLGVADVARSRRFYEALGLKAAPSPNEHIAFFDTGGIILALYGQGALAEDATVDGRGSGFRFVTIAHNVRARADVAERLAAAERAGALIVKPAQDVFWGGHSGYFADPDGHLWEVPWNPHWTLDDDGRVRL